MTFVDIFCKIDFYFFLFLKHLLVAGCLVKETLVKFTAFYLKDEGSNRRNIVQIQIKTFLVVAILSLPA
jgi:hypothetical protein